MHTTKGPAPTGKPHKNKRASSSTYDFGTPELHKRKSVVPELTGAGHAKRARVIDDAIVDVMLYNGMITLEEHGVLMVLTVHLDRAGRLPSVTANYSGMRFSVQAPTLPVETQLDAESRLDALVDHLDAEVGETARNLVLCICRDEIAPEPELMPLIRDTIVALAEFFDGQ